jgi:hypothetical protein
LLELEVFARLYPGERLEGLAFFFAARTQSPLANRFGS